MVRHGAAWLWLVLDMRRRMGEGAPQGCPGATAVGRATGGRLFDQQTSAAALLKTFALQHGLAANQV